MTTAIAQTTRASQVPAKKTSKSVWGTRAQWECLYAFADALGISDKPLCQVLDKWNETQAS